MAVTVYTPSPALNSLDTNNNINFRIFVQLSANSNGQLRVTFRNGTAGLIEIDGASFGKWDGSPVGSASSDMSHTPFRITFGGVNDAVSSSGSNQTITSDWITHTSQTYNSGDWIIVSFFLPTGGGNQTQYYNGTGSTTCFTHFYATATDLSQAQTAAASGVSWSNSGGTQPGASGGRNFSVSLVETNDPSGGGAVAISGLQGVGEGIVHGTKAGGMLHPIGRGWTGWKRQGKLIVPDRKLIRRAA